MTDVQQYIQVKFLYESPSNPRKQFEPEAMAELVESVKAHGVLQPLLVRRRESTSYEYEVVAGARRFRAAVEAGLREVPVTVRELTDQEVLEIQVIENLQREDLHPLDEAEGFRRLIAEFSYKTAELAKKLGKSKAYVYARIKLLELGPRGMKLFRTGKLDASRALLIARIPDKKTADEAAKRLTTRNQWELEIPSFRTAQWILRQDYTRELKGAPFNRGDSMLVKEAGACNVCPFLVGNNADLYGSKTRADVCTHPRCFEKKVAAAWDVEKAKAKERGDRIKESKNTYGYAGHDSVFVTDQVQELPGNKTWSGLIKRYKIDDLKATTIRFGDGSVRREVNKNDLKAKLRKAGLKFPKALSGHGRSEDAQTKKQRLQHEVRKATIAIAIPELVAKAEAGGKADDIEGFLMLVVKGLIGRSGSDCCKAVSKRRGLFELDPDLYKLAGIDFDREDDLDLDEDQLGLRLDEAKAKHERETIGRMKASGLRGLIVELIATYGASSTWQSDYGNGLQQTAEFLGVDIPAIEAKLAAEATPKPTKAPPLSKKKAEPKRPEPDPEIEAEAPKTKRDADGFVIDELLDGVHDWEKDELVGGTVTPYICRVCGVKGKRYGISDVVRMSKAKKNEACNPKGAKR